MYVNLVLNILTEQGATCVDISISIHTSIDKQLNAKDNTYRGANCAWYR